MAKRSHTQRISPAAPLAPGLAVALAQGPVNTFFADLFIHLNRRLERTATPAGKALAVREARQYLRGAEALWGCTKTSPAMLDADDYEALPAEQLLEQLFLDAHAYMAEIESQLAQPEDRPESPACTEDGGGARVRPG